MFFQPRSTKAISDLALSLVPGDYVEKVSGHADTQRISVTDTQRISARD